MIQSTNLNIRIVLTFIHYKEMRWVVLKIQHILISIPVLLLFQQWQQLSNALNLFYLTILNRELFHLTFKINLFLFYPTFINRVFHF